MQDIDRVREPDGINGPVCIAIETLNNLEDAWAFSLPRLCIGVFASKLRYPESITEIVYHCRREGQQIGLCRANPM